MKIKNIIIIGIFYLVPLSLSIELITRLSGRSSLNIVSQNNNIFEGILNNCTNNAYKESEPIPNKLYPKDCSKNNFFSVLNIKPNFTTKQKSNEFNVEISTNKLGFRIPNGRPESQIIILGDSFTYGHGVNAEDRFSETIKDMCQTEVLNTSYMNGFQPEHYHYYFKINNSLRPKVAIINLFVSNDLYSDVLETIIDNNGNIKSLPARSITNGGMLGGVSDTVLQKNKYLYRQLLKLSRYSAFINSARNKMLTQFNFFGEIPTANIMAPKELLEEGSMPLKIKERIVSSLNRFYDIGIKRNNDFTLLIAVIPDSLTDLNLDRMKYVNANIIRDLKTDLDENIVFVDPSLNLKSSDFYLEDRHYNKYGHFQHARSIAKRLHVKGIFNCEL
tara:strand:- start:334 stop:1500 length:1167 start_codon:yes stop_codon:yes gene_type:complete